MECVGAGNKAFCRVKWLQTAMKGSSCVRRVRLQSCFWFLHGVLQRPATPCKNYCNGRGAAKRIAMAASRFLAAAAVQAILLCCAAGQCNGCTKGATVIFQQMFLNFWRCSFCLF